MTSSRKDEAVGANATPGVRPLAGLKVWETSGEVATAYCGRLLALLGAAVTRAEGEPAPLVSTEFAQWLDQGKASASRTPAGVDLVIAGQTADRVAKIETDIAAMGEAPTLLGLTWFDPRGPYAARLANDPVIEAMSGLAFGFGEAVGPPILAQGYGPQIVAGFTAFIAVMAAMMNPRRRPKRIEVSVFESALCFTETGAVIAAITGTKSQRLGVNRFSPTYPCTIYRTADGYAGVTALTPSQWAALADLIGLPEFGAEPGLATAVQRLARADELDELLAPKFVQRPTAYWVAEGERRRIPITPAPRPGELPALEHWRARGAFEPLGTSPGAPAAPTLPFRFAWTGANSERPAGGPAGPLAGVRVADFSMGWAGPLAARYLGDLGADVLKIESRARPDWWRGWEASVEQDPPLAELQPHFMAVNRSKRGLDLDLSSPEENAIAARIARASDVVIENQGPGVMDRLGLGPETLNRANPALVYVSMPPFGRTGPLAGLRAYGSTVEQASGLPFVNGREDWPPCLQHVAYGDPVAGLFAAAAALVGLYGRGSLGGAIVDLCQVECLFQLGADAILAEQVQRRPWPRTASRRAEMAPCCVIRCAGAEEAWLAVAASGEGQWRALLAAIGENELAAEPEFASLAARKAAEDEIETRLAEWAKTRPADEAARRLQEAGVPAGEARGTHSLCGDPHLAVGDYWARQTRRFLGEHLTPRLPFRYDGVRPAIGRPAPVLGEHTAEALAELEIKVRVDDGSCAGELKK
ncbi:MAG: CoA transferase [Caulobacteraceae bacterium]